jgi:hypothetical protein
MKKSIAIPYRLTCTFGLLISINVADLSAGVELADNNNTSNLLAVETVLVQGYRTNLLGETLSASEGIIGSAEIANRPVSRTGEILEFVPGMVVTQHSGSGKANQYFLRGFNLDHGTDFNTSIDGMPVNMRTHGHGQGYTDLNFIIPEFIDSIHYHKGPYYADVGDFSGAGAAAFNIKNEFAETLLSISAGENNYKSALVGGEVMLTSGKLLIGFETQTYDGPWVDINEDVHKYNLLGRYVSSIAEGDFSLTFMAYDNQWNSADQIPERAVLQNIIDARGSLDTGVGGDANRYSLSSSWRNNAWELNAYAIRSALDLFSNFTYFLDDPINGDQFEQVDERSIFGGAITHSSETEFAGKPIVNTLGAELRRDNIGKVGLYHTADRLRLSTTREDEVNETSLGLFSQSTLTLTEKFSTHLGLRYDYYTANVTSDLAANTGDAQQDKFSVKAGARYRFNENTEAYVNAGQGFHSNDARGATITQDPVSGEASDAVNLLVPSTGAEIGIKLFDAQHFNLSSSLWYLRSDSELVFVGDAGNTETSRASARYGSEIAGYYWLNSAWSFDVELAWTRAEFTEQVASEGKYIDGSVPVVASAGISYGLPEGFHSSLRYRYFGARKLDNFNENKARATGILNLGLGYRFDAIDMELNLLNLLDTEAHDIDYFYASRLNGEPDEGVEDLHYHPVEPRAVRVKVSYRF